MITIKDKNQQSVMTEGGLLLGNILKALLKKAKPGVKTADLDKLAEQLIVKTGGEPSFKSVRNYQWATCMCVNDEVVHGIPDDVLKEGDILCIDAGLYYKGFHTDTAWTIRIKNQESSYSPEFKSREIKNSKDEEIDRFLDTGKKALSEAIKQVRVGNRVGHISKTIQEIVEGNGFSVVKALVGHGIGRKLHEDPQIPGFIDRSIAKTTVFEEGMTLAIEVIYNMGKDKVEYKNDDGWTIVTADGSLSAVFEHTVLLTNYGPKILTD